MPRNTSLKMKRGLVGTAPTNPRPHVPPNSPSKTARTQIILVESGDQLSLARAREAVDEVAAALAPLSVEERSRICALAGVAVVLGHVKQELSPKQAAARAGVTPGTILRWIARFGIGRRVAGRYVVDRARLEALLAGVRP